MLQLGAAACCRDAPMIARSKTMETAFISLNLTLDWKPCNSSVVYRFDDSSAYYYGDFGKFRLDTRVYTVVGVYVLKGSAHTFEGKRFAGEINIKGKSSSGATATLVVFVEYGTSKDYDTFFYSMGFGRGELKKMYAGSSAKVQTQIDLFELTAQPLSSDTFYHYMGSSMFDTCENSHYVFFKPTIRVHKDQLAELLDRPQTLPLYPIRLNMYTSQDPNPEPNNSTLLPNVVPLAGQPKPEPQIQIISGIPTNNNSQPVSVKPVVQPANTSNNTNTTTNNSTTVDPAKLDQPNPAEPIKFNTKLFGDLYSPYPPPRNATPPANSEEYPAEEFPYPDAWPWTGEPNYPNDPWYPEFYFPEQKIFKDYNPKSPRFDYEWPNNELPKEWPEKYWPEDYLPKTRPLYYPNGPGSILLPFSSVYLEEKNPETSPEWPHGYPIWASAATTVPAFPQNADFFPRVDDPYYPESLPRKPVPPADELFQGKELDLRPDYNFTETLPKPNPGLAEDNPTKFIKSLVGKSPRHPELPAPIYSYPKAGNSTYPRFPREHWPDNPYNPKLYEGYPEFPSNDLPPTNPKEPSTVKDPKIKWPQNPYFTWPDSKNYMWPKDNRFTSPDSPEDAGWYFPKDPTKDPKWRRPVDATSLPKPINQRTPEDPVIPNKPIIASQTRGARIPLKPTNSSNQTNTTNVTNNTTEPQPLLDGYHPLLTARKEVAEKKSASGPTVKKFKFDPFGNPIPDGEKAVERLPEMQVKAAPVLQRVVVPQDNFGYHPAYRLKLMQSQNGTNSTQKAGNTSDTPQLDPNQLLDPFGNPIPMALVDMQKSFRDPKNFTMFAVPELSAEETKEPKPRPGYAFPDPSHLVTPAHGRSPFPIEKEDVPRTYKGIPNQPFGLLPPNALPAWEPLNSALHSVVFRSPPPAPVGSKWIPYFYYPLPHSTVRARVAVVAQYILVPADYMMPASAPATIPVLLLSSDTLDSLASGKAVKAPLKASDLLRYNMPVLRKPVDPVLKEALGWRALARKVLQARKEKNAWLAQEKLDIEDFKVPIDQRPDQLSYDRGRMEVLGFDVVCDEWSLGVLVNRHFVQAFEWGYSGDNVHEFDEGKYRYCKRWHNQPRFKDSPLVEPTPNPKIRPLNID